MGLPTNTINDFAHNTPQATSRKLPLEIEMWEIVKKLNKELSASNHYLKVDLAIDYTRLQRDLQIRQCGGSIVLRKSNSALNSSHGRHRLITHKQGTRVEEGLTCLNNETVHKYKLYLLRNK